MRPTCAQEGEDFFEPALGLTHADGNKTTYLYYKDSQTKAVDGGNETVITLADNKYALRCAFTMWPTQSRM